MRVKLEKNYKDHYTIADLERAKEVIAYEKEDEMTIKGWVEYAVREALKDTYDYTTEILKAEAHTAKNYRAWNNYTDTSEDMDVWVSGVAETARGFIKIGAYLSDIWQTGANDYADKMFIQYFNEAAQGRRPTPPPTMEVTK